MDKVGTAIKSQLEVTYDIPFHVENCNEYRDRGYRIWPENDLGELFEVRMLYRQGIRLIIEVKPQKYAAEMLNLMQRADNEKIKIFIKYVELMQKRKAKVEMSLNGSTCTDIDYELWDNPWKSLKLRISVIPEDNEIKNIETELFTSWAGRVVGMMLALLNIEKIEEKKEMLEGGISQVLINKYERNPVNRQLCLMANGYTCKICGFDFEEKYGKLGHRFIHVHHIEKISSHNNSYYINPETDLIPVCPNCHAMLHKVDPPLYPKDLISIIQKVKTDKKENDNDSIN